MWKSVLLTRMSNGSQIWPAYRVLLSSAIFEFSIEFSIVSFHNWYQWQASGNADLRKQLLKSKAADRSRDCYRACFSSTTISPPTLAYVRRERRFRSIHNDLLILDAERVRDQM